ncbi:MAG TPA: patatin-like phospholipase family protein, partial [Thermoanaerobaculia bacterium]|nr:patatin-like phospholipase family protein [Thermoanaerobaculia bacterium]
MRALRLVRHLPLLVLALALPAGLVACSDGSSPTEPAPVVSAAPAAAAAAPVVIAENGTAARGGARALRQEATGGEAPR